MESVFIIIVTWNGMKWIDKCLTSIYQSDFPLSTIVVDNNSADETAEHIANQYKDVTLIRSDKNLGFGRANNIGIKTALSMGADYCFLLNQDAYLQKDTIGNLVAVARSSDCGIISPVHLNGDGSKMDPYFRDYVLAKNVEYLEHSMIGGEKTLFESKFIPAAAWLLPKKTLIDIGGFDSLFYHYGEDDNYCQRCVFHMRSIVFSTTAFVQHDRESTVGNTLMYNRKLSFRHIVQDCANINYSAGYIIQKQGRQLYDEIGLWFMYLLTGKWSMLHNFFWDYLKVLLMIPQFVQSRNDNKKQGGFSW